MSAGLTPAWASLRVYAHSRPYLVDCLVVVATFGVGICAALAAPDADADALTAPSVVLGVLAALVLLPRRRWPLSVLAAAITLLAVGWGTGLENPVLQLAMGVAIYTVAVRRRGAIVWCCAVLACLTSTLASLANSPSFGDIASVWTWLGLATLAGYSVRGRRDYILAVEDRALRAEQGREQEARRQVAEERLRIARELHDVVGHHVALIKVQSAVAAHVLRTDPDRAEESLGHVREASRTVLDELSALVRVLREPDEPIATRPARGLAHLDELVAGFAASGLPLTWAATGQERELPALVDLAAYRIVQECLTNAYKHGGGGHTHIRLAYEQHGLRIQVHSGGPPADLVRTGEWTAVDIAGTDPPPLAHHTPGAEQASESGYVAGHGIIGMRERAATLGGQLHAGRGRDGSFTISARLPLPPPADSSGGTRTSSDHDADPPPHTSAVVVALPGTAPAADAGRTGRSGGRA
ncbi:sensor histidine kinase [Parafrankia sp. FMc2]|uniref:sensor histidine kinase n=1 Tax=Parafrankia sp. FMc2 TaxID=3233196 RepID=UPI0034D51440